jgi:hypothetical protein
MATRSADKVRKKTAFVPRIVFHAAAAAVSVVPLCVTACGGTVLGVPEAGADVGVDGVACRGFGPCAAGVATMSFDASSDINFVVACEAFDGGPCGQGDAELGVATRGFDGGDAELGVATRSFDGGDAELGVTTMAFDASADAG